MDLTFIVNELIIESKAVTQLGKIVTALDEFNKEYVADEGTLEQAKRFRAYLSEEKARYEKSVREYCKMISEQLKIIRANL
jgi:hypothetical protein